MRRPRLSIRGSIALVALVALLLYGAVLWQRSEEYRRRAESHGLLVWWALPAALEDAASLERLGGGLAVNRARLRWIEYHDKLSRKYWRAAARPWVFVRPDPPPPD